MVVEDPVVLLVDDSPNDVLLMRMAFKRTGFARPLHVVHDGEEAIKYLGGKGAFADRTAFPLPTVILLDLNMPRKNGFEVMEWIQRHPDLRRLRIYVLSASSRPCDIERSYDLGACTYLMKPGTLEGLLHLTRCFSDWLALGHFAGPDEPRCATR